MSQNPKLPRPSGDRHQRPLTVGGTKKNALDLKPQFLIYHLVNREPILVGKVAAGETIENVQLLINTKYVFREFLAFKAHVNV